MRSRHLFLLVYLLGSIFGDSSAQSNATCPSSGTCNLVPHAASQFLHCVGLPSMDTGADDLRRLKGMLEAMMDLYTFMKSSMTGVPLLSLQGALELNPNAEPLQNEALVQMWMEVKIKPLLSSISKHFLSCLSTKNFSCSTYQTVVRELSQHFSEMNPVRQKWIYTFFMYPFLSGDRVTGCVNPGESSEEWLMKNFGAFRAMARLQDFSTLNMVFSGLEVLHLLSPAQKAELLMRPEVQSLENGTLSLVFHSLMTGSPIPSPTSSPGLGYNWMNPGYSPLSIVPNPPSSEDSLKEIADGFMTAFRPIGSFVHDFVSFTQERDVSQIRSTTLTQFLLNWTLAELADMYRPQNTSAETLQFDVTNVADWYHQVVIPVLRRFFPEEALMQQNVTLAFHELFYLENGINNETAEIQDVCSITLDKTPCGLTNMVENVAYVLHCAARTNLTMDEDTIMTLILELTKRLNSLVKELSTVNFQDLASEIQQIFSETEPPSLTQEHLQDPDFISLWFQIKLLPLLPAVHPELLSCLSTKNFSCPVYQTIVAALSKHMSFMDADPMYSHNIYEHFIFPFLLHHNTSNAQCVSSANHSAEWLQKNFGFFSQFASITDFYHLNPHFSGLEALPLLSPKQIAEMLLLPLPVPPPKPVVINQVFDFLMESPAGKFREVLHYLVKLAKEVNPPCDVFRQIFVRMYGAIPSLSPDMEPFTWAQIDALISIAPEECVPENITCPVTQFNGSHICMGVDSSDLQMYLNTSMHVSCNFPLEKYACAQPVNFTANQLASLLKCDLPGNSSHSKVLWKMLLTKLSSVLEPALDILADMPMAEIGPSVMEILDVISEIRLSFLTDEELMNSNVIDLWFSQRLSSFLPSASGRFLHCLTNRNLSCQSYQHILQVFINKYENMTLQQQNVVLHQFILRFLQQPHSGPGCVSNSSAEWLRRNLGPFSMFLPLTELLHLNPHIMPMEVLQLLTPQQIAELLVLKSPTLPDKDVIINAVFDYLTESSQGKKFSEFLPYLVTFISPANFSCSSYKTLFNRLDLAMATASLGVASSITYTKMALSKHIPLGCVIYSGECTVTMTNETDICVGVNSTELQLHLDSGKMSGRFCDFTLEEFACASLSALTVEDLALILKCNRSSNSSGSRPVWKLILSKASHVLDEALDYLSSMTLGPDNPALSMILDSIRELRLDTINMASFNDPAVIMLWFKRLQPFLPAVSPDFLSCLTTKGLNCTTYQHIVQILSHLQPNMTLATQMSVYTHFIKVYLTRNNTADPACSLHSHNSGQWLQANLGDFSALVSFHDIQMLNSNFSAMEALPQLTVRQLAEVSSTPGQLTSPGQVIMVMNHVPNQLLANFYDNFSPAIMGHETMIPSVVRSAMLQVVFDRANLSDHSVSDSDVLQWLHDRLRPLLVNLSPLHVAPFFRILSGRSCSTEQQGVASLNMTISTLSGDTQTDIYNHIIQTLKGPTPLRCYGTNYNHSFYNFLQSSFMGFQFPNLTTFLSLMPHDRMDQLMNSMPPSDLGDFLRRPDVVDSAAQLCVLYNNYAQTPVFLETESVPADVRRPTLPCVWPTALSSTTRSEVNAWFDQRLHNYLAFLTKSLISPSVTYNSTCMAFQKLVLVLGQYNYTAADFGRQDMFNSIRVYLKTANMPRCYNASDPELNSTAWFAEYIGAFMPFLTLEDLQTFGSQQVIQVFTVNPLNIALLNHSSLPQNLTNYYTQLIYQQDSNFNPLLLPLLCRCIAPGPAFMQLTAEQSVIVLHNLTTLCTDLDPQVSAALAGNFGNNIDSTAISVLGNESTGLSTGQINAIKPQDLFAALSTLSAVNGWNQGQANSIIMSLISSGMMKINSSSSLITLGSLIVGVPANMFISISGVQLLSASKNPALVSHLMSAPQIIQQIFVTQIISVNTSSVSIIENIPDELATEIPRTFLLGFTSSKSVITTINKKKWKQQQVELFFDLMGDESVSAELGSVNDLSSSVLQGFTCTGVRTIRTMQIKKLIQACRRKGKNKVALVETQLTCMYNYIKGDPNATSFDLFPPDVLLYYDYVLVSQGNCRTYFEQLADADFSVFSSALSYKLTALFNNAKICLGITNTSLTADTISVLGNMCCTLDGSYIENSDPSILDKLNNCPDLTASQAAAVEALLFSGKTKYGAPSTWDAQTLQDLGMLPLYLSSTFYDQFTKKTRGEFWRYFLKILSNNGVSKQKRKNLESEIRKSNTKKSKRAVVTECTVGTITQVTISDEAFPFNYDDVNQFNSCLSASVVKDNLNAITDKVLQVEYLKIVLSKLREAYNSTIPESQVRVLGVASRVATTEDISMWTITQMDTLAALMDSSDGDWDPSLAKAIISKYLSTAGNTLGSVELNAIGGPNLCSVDVDVLKNISPKSLKEANALVVSNCTTEKKMALFTIAQQAFIGNTRSTISGSDYQLTKTYLGGANLTFVRSLSASNISMDMATFTTLNENVVLNLTVTEVKGLLGTNLPDLKSYENQTLIQSWISRQYQSDLNTLGLNLQGGRADPIPTAPGAVTNAPITPAITTTGSGSGTSTASSSTTTGHGSCIRADAAFTFLVLLGMFFLSQNAVM